MRRRKERIRKGLEIDFDLIDSDMVRWHLLSDIVWGEGPRPFLMWLDGADEENWSEGKLPRSRLIRHDMGGEREWAEGLRILRLLHYKSYADLTELAALKRQKGEFVIRIPPRGGYPHYVYQVDEACWPAGRGDPDNLDLCQLVFDGFLMTLDITQALRFSHDEAIRLTIRLMEALGYDIPGEGRDYYEPVRLDVAEELHARANHRPRLLQPFFDMLVNLDREL